MTVVDDIHTLIDGLRDGVCTGDGPCVHMPFSTSKTSNFVARGGGLDPYVRAVARAFMTKGRSESEAIEMAIGVIRNWAEGKGKVTAATRARAAKALASWNALKAKAHASGGRAVTEWGTGGPGTSGPMATNYDPSDAGSLLPRGLSKKPHPDEAHGFRGPDLTSCAVCGRSVTADIHRGGRPKV